MSSLISELSELVCKRKCRSQDELMEQAIQIAQVECTCGLTQLRGIHVYVVSFNRYSLDFDVCRQSKELLFKIHSNSVEFCFGILESKIVLSFHLQSQTSFQVSLTEPSISVQTYIAADVHCSFSCLWRTDAQVPQIPQILRKFHHIEQPPQKMMTITYGFLARFPDSGPPAYPSGFLVLL